jgi:hypothetical protein
MNDMHAGNSGSSLLRVAASMAALAIVVTLASCGGNDNHDNGPVPPAPVSNTPPATASQNVDGFIAFLKILVPTRQDTVEPLDVSTFVAPTNDTGDPDPSI